MLCYAALLLLYMKNLMFSEATKKEMSSTIRRFVGRKSKDMDSRRQDITELSTIMLKYVVSVVHRCNHHPSAAVCWYL